MKTLKQKLAILLASSMILSCMVPSYAAPLYSEMQTEETELLGDALTSEIEYLDENGDPQKHLCTVITSADSYSFDADTWYVVKDNVNITNRITNNGTTSKPAHLILTDNCTFNVPAGINNESAKGLVIYGQTNNTGKILIDDVSSSCAGIGGGAGKSGGAIIINGGTINVTGGMSGAGIGGGQEGDGGIITINGGTVTATGGGGGAGIGGGQGVKNGQIGKGGTITISGGMVNATGKGGGSGIGGGVGGSGETITISGGTINASNGTSGSGIGGGGDGGNSGTIEISGGTINASSGASGAGIGGGNNGAGETIRISGGTINASSGTSGAGIGGGLGCPGGEITISGGIVTASSSNSGAGIGGGGAISHTEPGGDGGTIIISDGIVTAIGGKQGGAGIGGGGISTTNKITSGRNEIGGAGGTITISGGTVTAIAGESDLDERTDGKKAAGIGDGALCNETGTLSFKKNPIVLKAGATRSNATPVDADVYRDNHQNYKYVFMDCYAEYKVYHYKQIKIDGGYDKPIIETKYGYPGSPTNATPNDYEGYESKSFNQATISENGSTIVEINYDIIHNTITFHDNVHGTVTPPIKAVPGTNVCEPKKPTNDGWVFEGWYRDPACRDKYEFDVIEDIDLYAKWLIVVTLDAQGGTGGTASVSVATGSSMPEINVLPQREGYAFVGYYAERNGNGSQYYDIHGEPIRVCDFNEPRTLYAYWIYSPAPREYFIISFDPRGGNPVPEQMVASGSTASESSATTEMEGHDFAGWFYLSDQTVPASEEQFDFDTVINKDYHLYAKWTPKQYEISWLNYDNAELAKSSVEYGTLPVYPEEIQLIRAGYVHTGWDPAIRIATQSTSYKATYESKLEGYNIVSYDSQGGSPVPAKFALSGATVSEPTPEPTREGYTFAGWKLDGTDFEFETTTIENDIILTASWTEEEYDITWYVDGIATTSSCKYGKLPEYSGSTTRDGYVFTGWEPAIQIATGGTTYTAKYYMIPVHGHIHTPQYIPGQGATCTADGWYGYYYCTSPECGATFSDAACTATISNLEEWKTGAGKITKSGHTAIQIATVSATTEKDGIRSYWYCGNCKKYYSDSEFINEITDLDTWKSGDGKIGKLTPTHTHSYGDTTYIWNADLTQCTAYHTCTASDCGYTELETVDAIASGNTRTAIFTKAGFATQTKTIQSGNSGSSSGGGSSAKKIIAQTTAFTGTYGNPVNGGEWTKNVNGKWSYTTTQKFASTWGYIHNPYATAGQPTADWFYFDAQGNMLTGWQQIMYNGVMTWFYFRADDQGTGTLGACQMGGKTPDGYTLNADGSWAGF